MHCKHQKDVALRIFIHKKPIEITKPNKKWTSPQQSDTKVLNFITKWEIDLESTPIPLPPLLIILKVELDCTHSSNQDFSNSRYLPLRCTPIRERAVRLQAMSLVCKANLDSNTTIIFIHVSNSASPVLKQIQKTYVSIQVKT